MNHNQTDFTASKFFSWKCCKEWKYLQIVLRKVEQRETKVLTIFPWKHFLSKIFKIIIAKRKFSKTVKLFFLWNISYIVYCELYLLDSCQKFLLEITRRQFFRVIYCKKQLLWKSVVLMKGALFGNKNLLPFLLSQNLYQHQNQI